MDAHSLIISGLILGAGIISIELGVSVAILEIIAGLTARNVIGIIDLPWIEFLAGFGLLGIMFFAGFETDGKLLKKYWRKNMTTGIASYFVPLILVSCTAYYLFEFPLKTSVLVGIALSTTSLALVYSILQERNWLAKESLQILLSTAMIVDVLSMLSLTLVFDGISIYSLLFLLVIIVSLTLLPPLGRWLIKRYHAESIELQTRFILLVLLSLAVAAEGAGVHSAILAFLTGFIFSELIGQHQKLEDKLRAVIFGFLAPLFFFQAGMTVNLNIIDRPVLSFVMILGSIAFFGKFIGSYGALRLFFTSKIAHLGGLLFNFRLSFGIIVATFGLHAGHIPYDLYAALLGIILATSVISSVLMKVVPHEI